MTDILSSDNEVLSAQTKSPKSEKADSESTKEAIIMRTSRARRARSAATHFQNRYFANLNLPPSAKLDFLKSGFGQPNATRKICRFLKRVFYGF